MFRSRRSNRYVVRRAKRNAERHIRGGNSVLPANTQQVAYTFTATEACVVKSIRLDVGATGADVGVLVPYVMVRVQEGYNANSITYPALTSDMYNPTNEVMMSGILTDQTSEDHKSNFIGRKLKDGDRICLIFLNGSASSAASVSFEISFTVLT